MCVYACVALTDLLLDVLCTLNVWPLLQPHLGSDVKLSEVHLHFKSVIQKFWFSLIVLVLGS